jgi:hypothetical protein
VPFQVPLKASTPFEAATPVEKIGKHVSNNAIVETMTIILFIKTS